MGLVTGRTKRIEPSDGGWIDIRALSWVTMETARTRKFGQLAEVAKALKDIPLPEQNGTKPDRMASYDLGTLLKHGIVAWSYADEVNVDDLDDATARWAARQILDHSLPDEAEVGKA